MRLAIVTGANKGIGLAIVRRLALTDNDLKIILTSRNADRGQEAVGQLKAEGIEGIEFHQLDILDKASIAALHDDVKASYGEQPLDILICNAGIATKGDAFNSTIAATTIGTNYTATGWVCDAMWDLLRPSARVVIVGSMAGRLGGAMGSKYSNALQERFLDPALTRTALDTLVQEFIALTDKGKAVVAAAGWPTNTYSVSKAAVHALCRILAREEGTSRRICVNACCPGWVRTDMGGPAAHLTPDQGSVTPVWLALRPADDVTTGEFYQNKRKSSWV